MWRPSCRKPGNAPVDDTGGLRPEFILLTGALGSGKTTLLSEHLAMAATADTGVIINDAGEVNVDGAVIGSDHRNLALATLSDGCICCSLGNSLQDGIDALLLARAERGLGPLRRIILETSGLAEPAPILRSLGQVRQTAFDLRIISTFDALHARSDADFLPQYAAQLAAAHSVVLTKLDELPHDLWEVRAREARAFNPLARQVLAGDPRDRARIAFAREPAGPSSQFACFAASEPAPDRITIAFASWSDAASWAAIGEWIENVAGYFDTRLLRMKGLVRPAGFSEPLLINGVGNAFSPPRRVRSDDDAALGLMMILRDSSREEFEGFAAGLPTLELRFS